MRQAICYDQPAGLMDRIVASGLIKGCLRYFDRRCLAFYDHDSFSGSIKYHNVCSLLKLIQVQSGLNLDQGFWKSLFQDQVLNEIADSILGRDILIVSRISKAGAEVRSASGYAGDQIGSNVIRFEKGPNNKIFMRKISYRTYGPDSTTAMYQNLQRSNIQAIAASFAVAAYTPDKKGSVIDMTDYINSDNDIFISVLR